MHDWEDIIRRHGDTVWKIAWRILANANDVSDCFQETFLAAVQIAQREPVENWGGLLRRVATLKAVKTLQKRSRSASLSLVDDSIPNRTADHDSPLANIERTEIADLLREALGQLPTEVSQVLSLRYDLQMSYTEIGHALGITVNHVGVLLHRGKQELQTRLGNILNE